MKKIIAMFLFAAIVSGGIGGVSKAFASDQCGDVSLNHPASSVTDPVTLVVTVTPALNNISCGGGSPEAVVNAWGTTNSQLPHLQPGQGDCPAWFTNYCVVISGTQYWKDRWGK